MGPTAPSTRLCASLIRYEGSHPVLHQVDQSLVKVEKVKPTSEFIFIVDTCTKEVDARLSSGITNWCRNRDREEGRRGEDRKERN